MTERRRALIVDAFTDEPFAGHPVGVLPDGGGLDTKQMHAIARELAVSETAVLFPSGGAGRSIRYLTSETELDQCGHAAIAAVHHMYSEGHIEPGDHPLETNDGVLDVEVAADGTVWLPQAVPEVSVVDVDTGHVAEALGIDEHTIIDDIPIARVVTDCPYLVVPLEFLEHLGAATPDSDVIGTLQDSFDVDGMYGFTFDTLSTDTTVHGRLFIPDPDRTEIPLSDTAGAAIGAYLRYVDAFDEMPDEIIVEHGHYLHRAGRIRVRVDAAIRVGGTAVTTLDGEIRVPEHEADEIIEA